MKIYNYVIGFSVLALATVFVSCSKEKTAEEELEKPVFHDYISQDSIVKGQYTLIFTNNSPDFATAAGDRVKALLEAAFFEVYPVLAAKYNPNTLRKVVFLIDPSYSGVAATANGIVHYDPHYMLGSPTDVDVVTHEVMHIVQAYNNTINIPGWLIEGIADYARYTYGVNNAGAGWTLPAFNQSQKYTDSYRVTARFLVWLEKSVKPDLVKDLNAACYNKTYSAETWKTLTGKTVDELWAAYAANPAI